jgi:hypothetical protein
MARLMAVAKLVDEVLAEAEAAMRKVEEYKARERAREMSPASVLDSEASKALLQPSKFDCAKDMED